MKNTLITILAFLTLSGIAYAQFPGVFQSYSYPVGNGTFNLQGTSSPTVGYITATSTTATSTFVGIKIGTSANGTSSPFQITATTTPGTPGSASASLSYGSGGYTANGTLTSIVYWIYPYTVINGVKIFATTPKKTSTTSDDGSARAFNVNVSWSAVANADGYRVIMWDNDIEGQANHLKVPICVTQDPACDITDSSFLKYIYSDVTSASFTDNGQTLSGSNDPKTTLVGPTGYGPDLYVDARTGDLFSPNGGYFGRTAIGTVTVYKKNRQVVYYNATNTDSYAYGSVLTQAVDPSVLSPGDFIVLKSGTYLINHMLLANGVCVVGQGMENSILQRENNATMYQSANPGYSFINFPPTAYSGCLKDMTVNITDLNRDAGIPIEIDGPSGNTASSTFLIQNIHTIAEVDGIFPYNSNNDGMIIDIINWHCETKWDCYNNTSITKKTTVNIRDSVITCLGPDSTSQGCSPFASRGSAQTNVTVNIFDSKIIALGGGVLHDFGMDFRDGFAGTVNLYNTYISTPPTGKDIGSIDSTKPIINSYGSFFDPTKVTSGQVIYGTVLSTSTGMYINGKVGIKTTTPTDDLTVRGTAFVGPTSAYTGYDFQVNGLALFSTTTVNACASDALSTEGHTETGCNSTLGPFQLISNRLSDGGLALDVVLGGYGDNGSGVRHGPLWVTAGTTTLMGNLILDTNGVDGLPKIGLGTTTPFAPLSVVGKIFSTATTTSAAFEARSTTASSTFANGLNLSKGCFAINNVCISGGGGGGSGTVTSVDISVPSIFSVSGNPITTSGTLALTYSGTALPVLNGGTGQTSFGQGWLNISDAGAFQSSTSPTVNYIVATSTTKASSFGGKVGVGTSTPIDQLVVSNGSSGNQPYITIDRASSATGQYGFAFEANAAASGGLFEQKASPNRISLFGSDSTEAITVGASGNAGSATTTPGTIWSIGGSNTGWNFTTGTTSSAATGGINILKGCFAVAGTCITGSGGGGSGTVTSVATNNGLTGGTITVSGTLGLDVTQLNSNMLTVWTGSVLAASSTPQATAYLATSTTATSTFQGLVAVGTTTPFNNDKLTVASTKQQITLTDTTLTDNQWNISALGGNLWISTSSPSTGATTSPAAVQISGTGRPAFEFATTSPKTAIFNLGVNPGNLPNGTTTINMGRMQFNGLDSGGAPACVIVAAGAVLTATAGPCVNN